MGEGAQTNLGEGQKSTDSPGGKSNASFRNEGPGYPRRYRRNPPNGSGPKACATITFFRLAVLSQHKVQGTGPWPSLVQTRKITQEKGEKEEWCLVKPRKWAVLGGYSCQYSAQEQVARLVQRKKGQTTQTAQKYAHYHAFGEVGEGLSLFVEG